jgi:hypothetical protein
MTLNTANRRLLRTLCAMFFPALAACGGGGSSPTGGSGGGGGGTQAITVTFSNPITQATAGGSATTLQVEVANDSANAGVTWAIMAGGMNCSPVCGTLQPAASPSLSAVYTPPASFPASPNDAPAITATSVTDKTKSATDSFSINPSNANNCPAQGNEAAMGPSGSPWAYSFTGFNTDTPTAAAGSVVLDGTGGIMSGVLDLNVAGFVPESNTPIIPGSSFYSVDNSGRGCLQVTFNGQLGATRVFNFVLSGISAGLADGGRLIEFDDSNGSGERGTGIIRAQDPTAFSTAAFSNGYSFGLNGWDINSRGFAVVGYVSLDNGSIASGVFDSNNGGIAITQQPLPAASNAFSVGSNGRGTFSFPMNGTTLQMAVYAVSAHELLLSSITQETGTAIPVAAGRMLVAGTSFSSSTLSGSYIVESDGFGIGPYLALLDFDGAGNVAGELWISDSVVGGRPPVPIANVTYSVDPATGRTTLSPDADIAPVFYAFPAVDSPKNGTSAFVMGFEQVDDEGYAIFQSSSPTNYSQSSLNGSYAFADGFDSQVPIGSQVGIATFDGSGGLTATGDTSTTTGLQSGVTGLLGSTYFVNPDGSGNFGPNTIMVTDVSHIFFLNENGPFATVVVLDLQ